MLKVEFKGNGKVTASDALADLVQLKPEDFQAIGPKAYPARAHSSAGIITSSSNGQKYQLVNAVIGDKGIVTFVADVDAKYTEGQELMLQFTEVVDGRARFNVISSLPTA